MPTQTTDLFLLIGTRLGNGVRSTRRPDLRNARNGAVSGAALRRLLRTTSHSTA
jgi:hypothetical protein